MTLTKSWKLVWTWNPLPSSIACICKVMRQISQIQSASQRLFMQNAPYKWLSPPHCSYFSRISKWFQLSPWNRFVNTTGYILQTSNDNSKHKVHSRVLLMLILENMTQLFLMLHWIVGDIIEPGSDSDALPNLVSSSSCGGTFPISTTSFNQPNVILNIPVPLFLATIFRSKITEP